MNVLPPSIAVGAILALAPSGRIAHKGYFDGRLRRIGRMLVTTPPKIGWRPALPVSSPCKLIVAPHLKTAHAAPTISTRRRGVLTIPPGFRRPCLPCFFQF